MKTFFKYIKVRQKAKSKNKRRNKTKKEQRSNQQKRKRSDSLFYFIDFKCDHHDFNILFQYLKKIAKKRDFRI